MESRSDATDVEDVTAAENAAPSSAEELADARAVAQPSAAETAASERTAEGATDAAAVAENDSLAEPVSPAVSPADSEQAPASARQRWWVLVFSVGVTALLLGAVAGSGWYAWRYAGQLQDAEFLQSRLETLGEFPSASSEDDTVPALVRVMTLRRDTIQPTRPLHGRLVEYRKVTVSSEVEGNVREMSVEEGTAVREGETLLVEIDTVWGQLEEKQIQAEIAAINAELANATRERDRLRQLAQTSTISVSDLESQESRVRQLQANVEKAQAMLEETRERLERSRIYAPFDGTVVAKHAELGQRLATGSPVVDIVSRGTIDAEVRVPESVIDTLRLGMQLPVLIEPLQLEETAEVVAIVPYGPTASRTFPVRLRLADRAGRLKVGMSVRTLVPEGKPLEEILVDQDAVLVRPDGSTAWVVSPVERGGANGNDSGGRRSSGKLRTVQPVAVEIVARDDRRYAIRAELSSDRAILQPGAEVVIEGAERLIRGQRVRVVTLDPKLLENLPEASGHELVE